MKWHGFGMFGMGGGGTDPAESGFSQRVAQLGINIHGSPYNDYDCANIAKIIDGLPPEDGIFVWGTSLGSNDTPVVCGYTKHKIDGAFGFQASIYGVHSSLTSNVKFAHLISSNNPVPFPGLGAYIWQPGTIDVSCYHRTQHDIPHPGDYDAHDQNIFLHEMKELMG